MEMPCSNVPPGEPSAENTADRQPPVAARSGPPWQSRQAPLLLAAQGVLEPGRSLPLGKSPSGQPWLGWASHDCSEV